jgi:hypothetical protein
MSGRVLLTVVLFASLTGAACAGGTSFKMDMSAAQIRKATSTPAVVDLAVGEAGTVQYLSFCSSNGSLFIAGASPLTTEKNDFNPSYLVEHDAAGYAVTATPDPLRKTTVSEMLQQIVEGAAQIDCTAITMAGSPVLPVASLNGSTSASQIFGR